MRITPVVLRVISYGAAILFASCGVQSALGQDDPRPFELNHAEGAIEAPADLPLGRMVSLERRFLASDDWNFYHAIDDLPADMLAVLFSVAGRNVVGPGEAFNRTDVHVHPGNTQHLYSAATGELGVVLWYSGGWTEGVHVVIYDRIERDAVRYDLGIATGPVLPLRGALGAWIQRRGQGEIGFEYLPSGFAEDAYDNRR